MSPMSGNMVVKLTSISSGQIDYAHPESNSIREGDPPKRSAGGGLRVTLRWQQCRIITVPACLTGQFVRRELEFDPKAIPGKSAGADSG